MRALVPEDLDPIVARDAAVSTLVRAAIAVGLNKLDRRPLSEHIKRWQGDRNLDLVVRAATSPMSTTALPRVTQAFFSALIGTSAGANLLARGLSLDFAGATSIIVPEIAVPTADFVGEMAAIPVQPAATSAGLTMSPHKLAVISSLTSEMMRSSNAEQMVKAVLLESTGPAIDKALFSAAAASAIRPAGILNGITPLTPATGTEKSQALVDDLAAIAGSVAPVAGNGGIVLVAAPGQAVALALRIFNETWPVLTSATLPAGTVIGVAGNALVAFLGDGPQIDATQEAIMHEETGPSAIINASGTVATPVRSMYQTDSVALRVRWPITWALRSPRAVAWMTAVSW